MTQRVARPMKFAAFISIIISVAVIFAACEQGPGAHEHDDLAKKSDFDDHGHTHSHDVPVHNHDDPNSVNALVAVGGGAAMNMPASIWVNDKHELVGATLTPMLGDVPDPIDVSEHFIGGNGELTYKLNGMLANQYYTAKYADGMVTIAKNEADTAPQDAPEDDGDALSTFSITATDEYELVAKKYFSVRRNLAPDGEETTLTAVAIGTQGVENPVNSDDDTDNDQDDRPMLNQIVFTIVAAETGGIHFSDADPEDLTVKATSSDPATTHLSPTRARKSP